MKLPAQHGVRSKAVYSSVGSSLLRKMGWSEGKGLGKNEDGTAECIKVKQKQDTQGVGSKTEVWDWKNLWWEDAFNATLQRLQSSSKLEDADEGEGRCNSSDEASQGSEEREREGNHSKKRKTNMKHAVGKDGIAVVARKHEIQISAELAKDPWGRWGGKNGKLARIARQEEEFMLQHAQATDGGKELQSKDVLKKKRRKRDREERTSKRQERAGLKSVSSPVEHQEREDATSSRPLMPESWWGHKIGFVHGGCLESLERKEQASGKIKSFTEGDQANIYMSAQNLKQQGKLGLGVKGSKMNTNDWNGKKTLFDGENDVVVLNSVQEIKWKKIVKRCILKEPKREIRLKKLLKEAVAVLRNESDLNSSMMSVEDMEKDLDKWLSGSSKIDSSGKKIRYVSG